MTLDLQKLAMSDYIRDTPFSTFSEQCSQYANQLRIIQQQAQKDKSSNSQPGQNTLSATGNNTGRGRTATPKPKEEHPGKLSDEKLEQYKKEGRCFNCSE
jgi:hypothetical protein